MRQTFIIGVLVLWVLLTFMSNIAEQTAIMGQIDPDTGLTQKTTMEALFTPDFTDVNLVTIFPKTGSYIALLRRVLLLYYPVIWQGQAIWLYYAMFFPVGISFIVVLLLALRGVGSQ